MELTTILFLAALFLVALLYSSVGHGGASGYLALMALFHFAPESMRSTALVLNVLVSLVAAWQYAGKEKLNIRFFLWLIAGSIPLAYLGARITVDAGIYKMMLGGFLLFHAVRLLDIFKIKPTSTTTPPNWIVVVTGAAIGLISGMIGVGGGIILSPLLLAFGWAGMKQTALTSALFIFVNSAAGLAGLFSKGFAFESDLYLWLIIAFAGGLIGSRLGSRTLSSDVLKKMLAVVLLIAGLKLILY
jgi:uncharacterized membrane protein YfcA